MHILIIEDDMDLGFALQQALKAENISSQWLRRLADAPRHFDGEAFDCVLLDIALPDGTGLELLARWRKAGVTLPVIMITARSALEDRLAGLDGGADDFIVKPFATAELVSRIRAVLRRYAQQASEVWQVGELQIEPRRYQARIGAVPLDLSPREFHLMLELAREPGKVVPKGALAQRLEPLGDAVDFGAIEVHVSNLRRKIGAERIRTVRGLARIDSGRPGKAQTLDIAQLVREELAQAAPDAMARGIELSLESPDALPQALEAHAFQSILQNFLSNALRYVQPGGQVAVELRRDDDGAMLLSVADNGPGIPEAERALVFERFYRAAGQEATGSGLGLAIATQTAQRLGGAIRLDTGPAGAGCTFTATIPAVV